MYLLDGSRVEYLHLAIGDLFVSYEIIVDDIVNLKEAFATPDVAKAMKNIDINRIVSGLANSVKSLLIIAITVAMREHGVWRINRDGKSTFLQRLDPSKAKKVVQEEERL